MNLSENPMYNDDEYYDLADPANAVLIERIQGYGEAGKFILDLLGQAKAGGITMQVKGLSSVPKIKYGEDEIYLSRRISTDADEMAPTHMHWCMSMESYKKSWVQSVLSGVDSAGWLELGNLTTTALYEQLFGEIVYTRSLEAKLGIDRSGVLNVLNRAIAARLDDVFTRVQSQGEFGVEIQFRTRALRDQFLSDDPALMDRLRTDMKAIFEEDLS